MSLSKRIFDLARANLNALLDKAGAGETSVDELTDDELEAELARRRERRRREEEERAAARRAAENARARAAAKAAASATRAASAGSAQAGRSAAGAGPGATSSRQQKQAPPAAAASLSERRLRELYAQLEVPYGASFDEVKKSFRRLMRKYHPDLHLGNPQKHKTATQLTMSLTQAYNELELHLVGGPNKGGH